MKPAAAPEPRVVAIVAAFNEADVLDAVIGDLVRQRVEVYVLDNRSTDDTLARARAWLGRGVVGVELFPPEDAGAPEPKFDWTALLRRKEALALELDADWFLHHDADEFRAGPWADTDLRAAIARVDAAGYNAIDFAVLNFRPEDESFVPGADPRDYLRRYEPGETFDARQVKCWKRLAGVRPDLASRAGHDVQFPGRKVFPIRFQLLHFPLRSRSHAQRKIEQERRPRFLQAERDLGWHVQYDRPVESLGWTAGQLLEYDAEAVRLELAIDNRRVEELRRALGEKEGELLAARQATTEARRLLAARELDALRAGGRAAEPAPELERERRRADAAARRAEECEREVEELLRLHRELADELERQRGVARAREEREAALQRRILELEQMYETRSDLLRQVLDSTSWRITSPIRRWSEWRRARRR